MHDLAFDLGADIPACLNAHPHQVSGAGEKLAPAPAMPKLYVSLINPGVQTPTGPIFKAFDAANPTPTQPKKPDLNRLSEVEGLQTILQQSSNNLEFHAIIKCPIVGEVIDFLASCRNALGARMSGSGATCFALFEKRADAQTASQQAMQRGWWSATMGIADT